MPCIQLWAFINRVGVESPKKNEKKKKSCISFRQCPNESVVFLRVDGTLLDFSMGICLVQSCVCDFHPPPPRNF